MNARAAAAQKAFENLKHGLLSPFPSNISPGDWVIDIQSRQLDVLQRIFLTLEDFLTYTHVLSSEPRSLAATLATKSSNFASEIGHLSGMNTHDLWAFLKYPDLSKLGLSFEERRFVRGILRRSIRNQKDRILRVSTFWRNHYNVYLKYKHRFSVLLGMYQTSGEKVVSHIYVRSEERARSNRKKVFSYVIPVDLETANYYEEVTEDLFDLFQFILKSNILDMTNPGMNFFPPISLQDVPEADRVKLQQIVDSMQFVSFKDWILNMGISLTGKRGAIATRAIRRNHVYRMPRDIYTRAS